MKYLYRVDDSTYIYCCLVPTWRATLDITNEHDQESIVEECADDYFHNYDGWDRRSWVDGQEQLKITLVKRTESYQKEDVASFNVAVEYKPRFDVRKIEQ